MKTNQKTKIIKSIEICSFFVKKKMRNFASQTVDKVDEKNITSSTFSMQ